MLRLSFAGILLALPAAALEPTSDQISAIRSNCRRDFLVNCSGVPRGGKEAFMCLRNNQDKLSAACDKAVAAVK